MKVSKCEGCRSNRGGCLVIDTPFDEMCPCKICMIKMICIDPCEGYNIAFDQSIDWYHERMKGDAIK